LKLVDGKLRVTHMLDSSLMPRSVELKNMMLIPIAKDEFDAPEAELTFHFRREATGQPGSFVLDAGRSKGMIFKRVSGNP